MRFVVSVDTKPSKLADFEAYVRRECEGPGSGILCGMSKEEFRGYPGFSRRFVFGKGKEESVREDKIFLTKGAVFTLSMTYPAKKGNESAVQNNATISGRMLSSFVIRRGLAIREARDDKEYR